MRRKIVAVLEGPDGSGKTTLATALSSRLGLKYWHEGPEPELDGPRLLDRYLKLVKMAEDSPNGVVFDRLAISEGIYAWAMKRPDRLGPVGEAQVSAALTRIGAVRILCLPSLETCLEGAFSRGETYLTKDVVSRAWSAYAAKEWDPRWDFKYDWTKTSVQSVADRLEKRR